MSEYVKVKTLPQIAAQLGVDRATLVRLEQRGVIPRAPKVRTPVQGRIYDAALEKEVIKAFQEYVRNRDDQITRPDAPKGKIVVVR